MPEKPFDHHKLNAIIIENLWCRSNVMNPKRALLQGLFCYLFSLKKFFNNALASLAKTPPSITMV